MDNKSDAELFRLHVDKLKNESLCAQNGLLAYTYNDGACEAGYYNPSKMNLGDCIQSLAARQFLPRVDACIDRDRLAFYDGSPVNMIMNAWYSVWKGNEVFSDAIRPLMAAIYFKNPHAVGDKTFEYFKKHEPVGCRDYATRDFLRAHGIQAYFTGCMTLTLGETWKHRQTRNIIYFSEYKMGRHDQKQIDKKIEKILKIYKPCEIRYISHNTFPITADPELPMRQSEKLLDIYTGPRLVITRNLHCALPCLAMGVPVVFAIPQYDHSRYGGLVPFTNHIGKNEAGEFVDNIEQDESGFVRNPSRHKQQVDLLKQLCHAFMKNDSVTAHRGENNGESVFDEEGEWYVRSPVARNVRDFFCKKIVHRDKRTFRICKVFSIPRKS